MLINTGHRKNTYSLVLDKVTISSKEHVFSVCDSGHRLLEDPVLRVSRRAVAHVFKPHSVMLQNKVVFPTIITPEF